MKQNILFNIYVMSYRRSNKILTKDLLEYCVYVVREEEAEAYMNAGITEMLVIPHNATLKCGTPISSFTTTFYWIIENTPEDVICILDDDIQQFCYRLDTYTNIKTEFESYREIATSEIERIAQLLYDLNLGFACDNPQYALYNYTQEFTFKGMPGGTRWINKCALKAKYIPGDSAMSDIDTVMQELLLNRIILQPRYFHSFAQKDVNDGGQSRSLSSRRKFLSAMKNKWLKYFDYDFNKNQAKINVKR